MSSVINGSGLNYQGFNPVGRELRSLRSELNDLKKLVADLREVGVGPVATPLAGPAGPPGPAAPGRAARSDPGSGQPFRRHSAPAGRRGDAGGCQW